MNLRQVRKKTKSIGNVKKITKAMQLVSAVKMKKAQAAALDGRPYREGLEEIIRRVTTNIDPTVSPLAGKHETDPGKKDLIIYISSNKGLCGAFHLNLYRMLLKKVDFKKADFITVGKKGAVFVTRMGGKVMADFSSHNPLVEVSAIFTMALNHYLNNDYNTIQLVYNKFISTLRSEQVKETILPVSLPDSPEVKESVTSDYVIEPSAEGIIDYLLRSFIEEKIRGAILSSEAVEHSSRMIAMKNATDNANDVIYNLTLLGNKLRQTKITMELLDMVTAKESVEVS